MTPPNGLEEIIAAYGDFRKYMRGDGTIDPVWESVVLDTIELPAAIPLSWAPTNLVTHMRCNKALVDTFDDVFATIYEGGLWHLLDAFGGCYVPRAQKGSSGLRPSLHTWGAAVDLNPATNPRGEIGDMPPAIIQIFASKGFLWGGNFTTVRDDMHFQAAMGY